MLDVDGPEKQINRRKWGSGEGGGGRTISEEDEELPAAARGEGNVRGKEAAERRGVEEKKPRRKRGAVMRWWCGA
jgi:hypothetical protein